MTFIKRLWNINNQLGCAFSFAQLFGTGNQPCDRVRQKCLDCGEL